jgi:hypothetical protein
MSTVFQQNNSLHATGYTPDDGTFETETRHLVVEEGHETGMLNLGNAQKLHILTDLLKEFTVNASGNKFPRSSNNTKSWLLCAELASPRLLLPNTEVNTSLRQFVGTQQ